MSQASIARLIPPVLATLLTACGGNAPSSPSSSAAPSMTAIASASTGGAPTGEAILVAIGDSIPYNSPDDCPGCTGFVSSYASALETELGKPVTVANRSRHDGARSVDILRQMQSDDALLTALGTADVVLISIAFNDQPPFADSHDGCPPAVSMSASELDAAEAVAATSYACIDTVVSVIRDQVADVFARLREAAPNAAVGVLTPYDTWRGWRTLDQLDEASRSSLLDAETYWFQTWNRALCDEAEAIDAVCVDAYRAFNGNDGTDPAGEYLAADYTHPSQQGNDLIRDLLVEATLPDHRPP